MLKIKLNLTNEAARVSEIKAKLKEQIHQYLVSEGQEVDINKISSPIVVIAKDRRIMSMAHQDISINELEKNQYLAAVEREVYEG